MQRAGFDKQPDTHGFLHADPVGCQKSLEFRLPAVWDRVNAELRTEPPHATRWV